MVLLFYFSLLGSFEVGKFLQMFLGKTLETKVVINLLGRKAIKLVRYGIDFRCNAKFNWETLSI